MTYPPRGPLPGGHQPGPQQPWPQHPVQPQQYVPVPPGYPPQPYPQQPAAPPQHGGKPPRNTKKLVLVVGAIVAVLALGLGTWVVVDSVLSGQRMDEFRAAEKQRAQKAQRMSALAKPLADKYLGEVSSGDKAGALTLMCAPESSLNEGPIEDATAGKAKLTGGGKPVDTLAADGHVRFDVAGTWHGRPIGESWVAMQSEDDGKTWCVSQFGFERPRIDVAGARAAATGFVAKVNDHDVSAAKRSGCTAQSRDLIGSALKERLNGKRLTLDQPGEPTDPEPGGIETAVVYFEVPAEVDTKPTSASIRVESADGGKSWCIADLMVQ